jgi:ATPase subunit of ABC transporter with duplicated ATPase domains
VLVSHSGEFVRALCTETWRVERGEVTVAAKGSDEAAAALAAPTAGAGGEAEGG